MADQYMLKVTAGPDYSEKNQEPVSINSEEAFTINSPKISASLKIRVQNYRGLPTDSPKTSPYFSHAAHKSDLYSLAFDFSLPDNVSGHDLVFGNDFDHPIRDKLPPGFSHAMKIVQWFIDPGLYGDAYADEPYLYGPFLSSINSFRIGGKNDGGGGGGGKTSQQDKSEGESGEEKEDDVAVIAEGADGDGVEARAKAQVPADAAARKKFFLKEANLQAFEFEKGRLYSADFFNPYLDFNDFALRLPGFSLIPGITIPIISYWDGQPLRYVLKNRATDEVLFVVIFTLLPKDQEKNAADQEQAQKSGDEGAKEVQAAGDDQDLD